MPPLRIFIATLLLSALPATAQEHSDIAARLAADGLAPTEEWLGTIADPDPTERFALGGVRFLRAIEKTLQLRWRMGMNAARSELPVLRLPVPPNPAPEPFTPETVVALFSEMLDDLEAARAPLAQIGDADAVSLPIRLWDLWFDINMNGTRDEGEALMNVAGLALTGRGMPQDASPTLVFDTADAAWLQAYTHMLAAFAEMVLAFDPTEAIGRVIESARAMEDLAAETPYQNALDMQFGQQVDRLAMVYFALQNQPDTTHTMAAHGHLLQMIAANRVFWARVATETDNNGEWIPNDNQVQGLGLTVPAGTGTRWMAVLEDAEALLKGERLIPYWRLRSGAGLNLRRMFEEPVPVDLAEWAHGIGLMRYAEAGERVTRDSWLDFERLIRGDSLMFVIFLN